MNRILTLALLSCVSARPDGQHGHHAVHHHQPLHHHTVSHHSVPVQQAVTKEAPKTIAELVVSDSRFSTLLAAVKAAGLVETLSGDGPFTVFAPTNAAFEKVPKEALSGLLENKEEMDHSPSSPQLMQLS